MARYVTNFKLKSAVNDFGAAKKYLADADMTKYLIDDLRDYENMPELADKIVHIEWNLEEDWYGTINLETTEDISKQDLAVILEWVKGQNSDGLGEGFEQRNFARFYDEKRGRYYLASFMRRLPQFTKVSDSRRIKDENNVEDKAYLVKQLYEDYLRIDTALREMEQGASYYEQEIFLNKGINDLRKNISSVDPRTEKMFSYGLLRLDTALREMEQGASYYEQEVFLNEGMQSIFDAIQTLEYE